MQMDSILRSRGRYVILFHYDSMKFRCGEVCMGRIWSTIVAVLLVLGLTGCAQQEQSVQIIAMDTAMTFTA